MFQHNNSKSHELVWVTMSEWQFWRDNKKFMKGILVRWVWRTFFMQETYHMTICWQFSRHLWSRFLFSNVKEDSGVIRCLKPVIPRKEQNKLCYSLRLNELCKCMWQVNIGGLWRRYPHPPHSAEPRRPQPNEDWTLIIRRIWLPHETHTHTHRACLITLPPAPSLSPTHTQTHVPSPHKVFVVARSFAGCTLSPCVVGFGFFLHCRLALSAFPWQWFLWKHGWLELRAVWALGWWLGCKKEWNVKQGRDGE